MGHGVKCKPLSFDHKPENQIEIDRIHKSGSTITAALLHGSQRWRAQRCLPGHITSGTTGTEDDADEGPTADCIKEAARGEGAV